MRIGPGAHTKPVAVAPVPEVVQRTLPRSCPVRDLVMAIAGATERALRDPVHMGDTRVVGLRRGRRSAPALEDGPAAAGPVRDRPVWVEPKLQRVAGNVIWPESGRDLQIVFPGRQRLPRPAEDEIEIDVEPRFASHREGRRAVVGLVGPAQGTKAGRFEALRTERKPRKTKREPCLETRAVERRWVRLDRDLARSENEGAPELVAEALDLGRLEQARRAASEKQGAHARPVEKRAFAGDLPPERFEVAATQHGRRGRGREIAVRAARGAEGDVDVQGDPAGHRVTPSGFGSSASEDSSAVRPRSMSHSRDSCTNARRWLGFQSVSATMRSSPKSGRSSTYAV